MDIFGVCLAENEDGQMLKKTFPRFGIIEDHINCLSHGVLGFFFKIMFGTYKAGQITSKSLVCQTFQPWQTATSRTVLCTRNDLLTDIAMVTGQYGGLYASLPPPPQEFWNF